jgi:PAS domain S-box-containing protein
LIVEHDVVDVELDIEALRSGGLIAETDVVQSEEDFHRLLLSNTYDVVLADYRLPQWTGMDAFLSMRTLGYTVPFILVTGTLGEERAVDCIRQGVSDYVVKNNLTRLPLAVSRAVRERRARDEVERAQSHAAAAEREAIAHASRFAQLADNTSEVFFVMDADFRETLYINGAYEKVWGRHIETLYDDPTSFIDAIVAEDRHHVYESLAAVRQSESPVEVDFRIVRPSGERRWIRTNAIPVRDDNTGGYRIAGIARDITSRHLSKMALEASEGRFRALADASFDAIAVTQRGVLLEVNAGFLETFGYSDASEIIGQDATVIIAPESREETRHRLRTRFEGRYEMIGRHKSGRDIVLEATSRELDDGGTPIRITALRDITEQRMLEQKYRQAQKLEAVGRLAGSVAHDFNNLLTVIGSYTEFMRAETAADDPRAEYIQEISAAAKTAADLTRSLLTFSRKQMAISRVVAIDAAVVRAEVMLRRLIGEDIRLVVHAQSDAHVMIDPTQLEQVILNLAVNARDAMPTGGTLTIATGVIEGDSPVVRTFAGPGAPRFATLTMDDNGSGMDEVTRERAFEPFFTTKEHGQGTGLGLATVYAIATQAGGFVDVESEEGKGTRFRVFLPVVHEQVESETDDGSTRLVGGNETILLLEDSPPVRTAVRVMLERLGYTVLEAADGRAALGYAALRRPIDLLLTDVVMPEQSGREIAEKAGAMRPGLRVLFMSGYLDDAVLRHGIERETVNFIQKPFTIEALAAKVRETIDG